MTTGLSRKVDWGFFQNLVARQIRQDYLDNITGFAWLILQPLILLAVYAFVFSTIFKARIPEAGDIGFVPYLAIAFWPWIAFSEAVLKANSSITANAALIGKVAFATEQIHAFDWFPGCSDYSAIHGHEHSVGSFTPGYSCHFIYVAIRLRDCAVYKCNPGICP
jgi:ABC-type polysaccharide/polyol phosphate export permease